MKRFFLSFAVLALLALGAATSADARAGPGLHNFDASDISTDTTDFGPGTHVVRGRFGNDALNLGDYGLLAVGVGDCTGAAGADSRNVTATVLFGEPAGYIQTARPEVASPPVGSVG